MQGYLCVWPVGKCDCLLVHLVVYLCSCLHIHACNICPVFLGLHKEIPEFSHFNLWYLSAAAILVPRRPYYLLILYGCLTGNIFVDWTVSGFSTAQSLQNMLIVLVIISCLGETKKHSWFYYNGWYFLLSSWATILLCGFSKFYMNHTSLLFLAHKSYHVVLWLCNLYIASDA